MIVIDLTRLSESETGCKTLFLSVDKDFKRWFCEAYSLKRWSQKKFQKVFSEAVAEHKGEHPALSFDKVKITVR